MENGTSAVNSQRICRIRGQFAQQNHFDYDSNVEKRLSPMLCVSLRLKMEEAFVHEGNGANACENNESTTEHCRFAKHLFDMVPDNAEPLA